MLCCMLVTGLSVPAKWDSCLRCVGFLDAAGYDWFDLGLWLCGCD